MIKKNIEKYLLGIIAVSVVAFCALLWYTEAVYRFQKVNYTEVYAEAGIWDLSEIDFSSTIVRLQGNVEHIANKMLNPEQFAANETLIEIGNPIDVNAGRTARLTIIVPDNNYYSLYTLGDYARRIYINGNFVGQFGQPATSKADFKPGYGEIMADIQATSNTLNLIVQGANFAHREGSQYNSTIIGRPNLVDWFINSQTIVETLVIGMLVLLFIFHLLLALISGTYRLNLWFSLTCLIYSLRLSLVGSKVIFELFPSLNWQFALKAEYICISLSALLILQIIHLQFNNIFNKKILLISKIVLALFSLTFVIVDTYTLSHLMVTLTVTYSLVIIYVTGSVFYRLVRKPTNEITLSIEQKITMLSVLILLIAAIFDTFFFSGIYLLGIKSSLAEIAILMYSIGQTVAIFHISMKKIKNAQDSEQKALSYAKNLESLNKMKSEFLQNISHEMKTPLTVISTGVDYTFMQINKDDIPRSKVNNALDIIKNEASKLGLMVSGMIDLENMMITENRRKLDLGDLLTTAVSALTIWAEEKGNRLICDVPTNLSHIFADQQNMGMLIENILSNAIKYTDRGTITIKAYNNKQFVEVIISDNGCGITADLLPNVTQRGVSGSGGMGLGLYICQTIINAHSGKMQIYSEENKGTTVKFNLPIYGGQEEGH